MIVDHFAREMAEYRSQDQADRFCYALVDTNQQPNLNIVLDGKSPRTRPLSRTASDGPVLVELEAGGGVANWLLDEKRGQRLAIFLFSSTSFDEMWSHMRRFTKVIKPDGEEASFRFYDPQVFNQYVGVLSAEQRSLLFSRVDRVYAEYGSYLMRTTLAGAGKAIDWQLFSDEVPSGPCEIGGMSLPQIDLTDSRHTPLLRFSKEQYEFPIIFNRPALIADIDAYLREDFEQRMNCYAPGMLRAMIEAGIKQALDVYELRDLVVLRQFAELQWRVAPGFYKQPAIDTLLADTSRTPERRWSTVLSPAYEDALVEAYEFDRMEDWNVQFT